MRAPRPALVGGLPSVDPAVDAKDLAKQGGERPNDSLERPTEVFSEDWWGRTRPVLELHGYFRTRGELLHNFSLGRHDNVGQALWGQPLDNTYTDCAGVEHAVSFCGDPANPSNCSDKSQATANLRFRLTPELHISDNLRVLSQVDALDNVVLGTPFSSVGGVQNSIEVKRAWAEYATPVGQVRFGRMPITGVLACSRTRATASITITKAPSTASSSSRAYAPSITLHSAARGTS